MIFDLEHPDGCYCTCSCLAFGTPVQTGDGSFQAIEKFRVGDTVLACGPSLSWRPVRVEFSNGTPGVAVQRYTVLVVYKDTSIAVTSDHLFLMSDRKLKRADRLAPGDELLDIQGGPVPVKSVHIGNMHAGFHHIATSVGDPGPSLDDHLINTNGVISADYAQQLFYRRPQNRNGASLSFVESHEDLPVIGSPEYIASHSDACLKAPEQAESFRAATGDTHLRVSRSNLRDIDETGVFVPADATRIEVPSYAMPFLPPEEAEARAAAPKRAFNDPQSRSWTEWLLGHHGHFYDDISFTLDWASNDVNAYAWVERGTGQRRVDIKGGLVRDVALELEGIALVIAHEIGHHKGGEPTGGHPDGLSCEGQADYAGVAWVMRQVWFGSQYPATVRAAIAQMADLFGVKNDPTAPNGNAGCAHPAGKCRIATYYRAAALTAKPGCAG
ncbi:hypothetical protein OUY22_00390 [Nonomuraea sp. MCN248]|uniref:Hint domain-containing protein n=1 Tax=Nonomuraea corallina TaxID=2989783 RepID=A0ABT4S3T6_9ACTN|nr:hypothetical protein [Nonomuraea corallina]MDA0631861.1 hypothetical protein [Nonomuraea corallina]